MVSGHVQGRIECDSLEIVSTGRVYGEIASSRFVIEPGGQFVGESLTRDKQPVAALSYKKNEDGGTAGKEAPAGPSVVRELGAEDAPASQQSK